MGKFIKTFLLACIIFLLIYGLVLIPRVDGFITDTIEGLGPENPGSVRIINARDSLGDNLKSPITYIRDDSLFMLYDRSKIDISPSYIDVKSIDYDINESLKSKENCRISSNGKHIVYFLKINNENHLYKLNANWRETQKIGEMINSFALSKRGNVFFASGYENINSIFIYRNGYPNLLGKNGKAYYIPEFNSLVILQTDGDLIVYNELHDRLETIDTGVDYIYDPLSDDYNYTDMYDSLSLFYAKGDQDYIYTGERIEETKKVDLKKNVFRSIYENEYFHYSEKDKTLYLETQDMTYGLMRDVYKVFEYDELERSFILASSKAVYKAYVTENNRLESKKMFDLSYIYKKNMNMIDEHLDIASFDNKLFYITSIKSNSFILNIFNAKSWLNKLSVFNYKLSTVSLEGDSFSPIKDLDVSTSRRLSNNITKYDDDTVIYIPRDGKDKGKSFSIMTKNSIETQDSFNNEKFDSIEVFEGKDFLYFITYTKKDKLKNKLYIHANDISILILKDNFTSFDGHTTLYLIGYDEFEPEILNIYGLDRSIVKRADRKILFYGINFKGEN